MAAIEKIQILNVPIAILWQTISGFGDVDKWLAATAKCELDGTGVGTIRTLTTTDGIVITEKLEAVDEANYTIEYSLLEEPFPVKNYVANMVLSDAGNGQTSVHWTGDFDLVGEGDKAETTAIFAGFYVAGLAALEAMHNS